MTGGGRARPDRPLPLGHLLASGIIDSTGLAFGWTVFLLVINERGGLHEASILAAAMLAGVALSAPFSAWLSPRLSPSRLLRALAVGEGLCRLALFGLLWLNPGPWVMVPVVTGMNVLAWTAFAAMRSQVSRSEPSDGGGRSLTWYAVAIAGSEALAAGAASLLLNRTPPTPVLVAVAVVYVLSLAPQWWVGEHAERYRRPEVAAARRAAWTTLAGPCGLGAGVFLVAGAPALLATVLAFERYGSIGVVVSALSFAACSLGAARLQSVVGRWRPGPLAVLVLGGLLVGGWSLSGRSLLGLAVAQGCAGLAQCTLEGELDTRVVRRLGDQAATTGLALASSSRALGGALAVALLPVLLNHTSLAVICSAGALLLLGGAAVVGLYAIGRVSASFLVGFVAGRSITAVLNLRRVSPSYAVGYLIGVPLRLLNRRARPNIPDLAAAPDLPRQWTGPAAEQAWFGPVQPTPEPASTGPSTGPTTRP